MNSMTDFIAIKLTDNNFTFVLHDICKALMSFFEVQHNVCDSTHDEYIKLYIASSIARLTALENQIANKNSEDYINYHDDYNSLKEYLYANIEITHGVNNIAKLLLENVYRRYAAEDLNLIDLNDIIDYLQVNNNFSIIPCIYYLNKECIIMRICRDRSSYFKSQMVLI